MPCRLTTCRSNSHSLHSHVILGSRMNRCTTRRTRTAVNEPSTPSNSQGPTVCGNCQCLECPGPCLSPLSRPPYCDSCGFRHGPTYSQCSSTPTSTPTSTTTPDTTLTADNIGTMFTELSPYSPLRTESSIIHTPTPTAMPWTQRLRPKPI